MNEIVNEKAVMIKTTAGEMFKGKINIKTDERLSDVFTKDEIPFIILYGTKMNQVHIINKQHIIWAQPIEDNDL